MLYRLDYLGGEAVRDPVIGGDLITRHMSTARSRAVEQARESGRAIQISRIAGSGQVKPTLVIEPDGRARRPETMKPAGRDGDCKRGSGQTCFCAPCRAERREARQR